MTNLDNMNISEIIIYFRKIPLTDIINDLDQIKKLDIKKFNLLFLIVNNDIKKYLLDDKELFNKVMNIEKNKNKRLIIEIVDEEIRDYILKNNKLRYSSPGKRLVLEYLSKLNYNKFTQVIDKYNLNYLKTEMSLTEEFDKYGLLEYIDNYLNNKNFNPVYLLKIKNGYEFFIYEKFNILVDTKDIVNDKIYLEDNVFINYSFLLDINKKHITKLIKILKEKSKDYDNNKLFVSVIKLYMIYGYDDSKKIIEDFYTYSTEASLYRASFELFQDNRREFRLKNQKRYYYFGIEKDCLDNIDNQNKTIFKNICLKHDSNYINNFIEKIKKASEIKNELKRIDAVKEIIVKEIAHRENYYKERDIIQYKKQYKEESRKTGITIEEIYEMYKHIDIETNLDEKGHIIKNKELIKFLLGNCKRDNDCLLRLAFNKHALSLNRELYNIINNFDKIKKCISKNKDLSLYSLLDVIDISKTLLYDLKPDELDITLETLSKILNSRKYLKEPPEEIVKRVLHLHKERKTKIYSTIPIIKGIINSSKYEIVDFDDESLLTSGIDGGDCLKVGGEGEEFLRYCLISPNGAIMYIYNNNTKYILPCSRNGNMININSIDPRITNKETAIEILTLIEQIANIWTSDNKNGIDMVTITDIHIEEYIKNKNYKKIRFDYAIPLNEKVYTDYNKKDVTNYIIVNKEGASPNYNQPKEKYYQKRHEPYIYISDHNIDTEKIEIYINNISYSSINFLKCSDLEKKFKKDNYKILKPSDFYYIVGNKDWFIGITNKYNIIYHILPYDDRVIEEFEYYKDKIIDIINSIKVSTQKTNKKKTKNNKKKTERE